METADVEATTTGPRMHMAVEGNGPGYFEHAAIERLIPSGHNPRRHFNPEKLAELAATVREKGIVEPLIVRPLVGSQWVDALEIVCGERRYRAAKMAGLTHVPVIIRGYDDLQVLEVMAVENGQRADVHPLEEAEGYMALMDADGSYTAEVIAAKVGKSVHTIKQRLRFLRLTEPVRQAFLSEDITAGHAEHIAKLEPEDQARALEACFSPLFGDAADTRILAPIPHLVEWIQKHTKLSLDAPETAELFPKLAERLEKLTAKGERLLEISTSYDSARDVPAGVLPRVKWRAAAERSCAHAVNAVVVHGDDDRGKVLKVCAAKGCTVHFPPPARKPTAGAEQDDWQKREEERRQKEDDERVRWTALQPKALAAVAQRIKREPLTDRLLAQVVATLVPSQAEMMTELLGGRVTLKNFSRAIALVEVIANRFTRSQFERVAKKYRVDLTKLEAAIEGRPGPAVADDADTKPVKTLGRKRARAKTTKKTAGRAKRR